MEAAVVLKCKIDRISFVYLGLTIGGNPRRLSLCHPLFDNIQERLYSWKSKHLCTGGRLALMKYFLSLLPIYLFYLDPFLKPFLYWGEGVVFNGVFGKLRGLILVITSRIKPENLGHVVYLFFKR